MAGDSTALGFQGEIKGVGINTRFTRKKHFPEIQLAQEIEQSTPNVLLNQPLRGFKANFHCRPERNVDIQTSSFDSKMYKPTPKQVVDRNCENCSSDVSSSSSNEFPVYRYQSIDGIYQAPKSSAMRIPLNTKRPDLGENPPEYIHTLDGNVVAITSFLPSKWSSLISVTSHRPFRRRSRESSQQLERIDLPSIQIHPHKYHDYCKATDASRFDGLIPSDRSSLKDNNIRRLFKKDIERFEDDADGCGISTSAHVTFWHENYDDLYLRTSPKSEVQMPNICNFSAVNDSNSVEEKDSKQCKEITDWENAKGIIFNYLDQETAENAEGQLSDGQRKREGMQPISIHCQNENIDRNNTIVYYTDGIHTPNFHQRTESDKEYKGRDDLCTQGCNITEECLREDNCEIHYNSENGSTLGNAVEEEFERYLVTSPILNSPGPLVRNFEEEHAEDFEVGLEDSVNTYNNSGGAEDQGIRKSPFPKEITYQSYSAQPLSLDKGENDDRAKLPPQQLQRKTGEKAAGCSSNSKLLGNWKNVIKNTKMKTGPKTSFSVKQGGSHDKTIPTITKTKSSGKTQVLGKKAFQDTNPRKNKTLVVPKNKKSLERKENPMMTPVTREQLKRWSECLRNKSQFKREHENHLPSLSSQKEPIQTEGYMWLPHTNNLPLLARVGCSMFQAIKLPDPEKPTAKIDTKDKRTYRVPKMWDRLLNLPPRLNSVADANKAKVKEAHRCRNLKKCSHSNENSSLDTHSKQNVSGSPNSGTLNDGKEVLAQASSEKESQCTMFLCRDQQRAAEMDMPALGAKSDHLGSIETIKEISSRVNSELVKGNPATSLSTKRSTLTTFSSKTTPSEIDTNVSSEAYFRRTTWFNENYSTGSMSLKSRKPRQDTYALGRVLFTNPKGDVYVSTQRFQHEPHEDGCQLFTQHDTLGFQIGENANLERGAHKLRRLAPMSMRHNTHPWQMEPLNDTIDSKPTGGCVQNVSYSWTPVTTPFTYSGQNPEDLMTLEASARSQSKSKKVLLKTSSPLSPRPTMSVSSISAKRSHTLLSSIQDTEQNREIQETLLPHTVTINYVGKEVRKDNNEPKAVGCFQTCEKKLFEDKDRSVVIENQATMVDVHREASKWKGNENKEKNSAESITGRLHGIIIKKEQDENVHRVPACLGEKHEVVDIFSSNKNSVEVVPWSFESPNHLKKTQVVHKCSNTTSLSDEQTYNNHRADKSVLTLQQVNQGLTLSADQEGYQQHCCFYNSSRHNGSGDEEPKAVDTKPSTVSWKQFQKRHAINHDLFFNQRLIPELSAFNVLVTGSGLVDRSWNVNTSKAFAMVPGRGVFTFTGGEYQDMMRPEAGINSSLTFDMKRNHPNWFLKRYPLAERKAKRGSTKVSMTADQLMLQGHGISSFPSKQKDPDTSTNLDQTKVNTKTTNESVVQAR